MTIFFRIILFFLIFNVSGLFINAMHIFPAGTTLMSEDMASAYGIRGNSTGEQIVSFFLGYNGGVNALMVALGTGMVAITFLVRDIKPSVIALVGILFYNMLITSKQFISSIISSQHNEALDALWLMLGVAITFVIIVTFVGWYLGREPTDD